MTLPRYPYVVVDVNKLRDVDLIEKLVADFDATGQHVMLPFSARYELLKGTGNTFGPSMRALAQRPDAVTIAHSIGGLVGHELRYRSPVEEVVEPISTANHRALLTAIRDGLLTDEQLPALLEEDARIATRLAKGQGFDRLLKAGVKGIREDLTNEERNRIRDAIVKRGDRAPFRASLLQTFTREWLRDCLVRCRLPYARVRRLVQFPSIAALDFITIITISFRWAVFGGVEGAKQLENEGPDAETIVVALYGRDLISDDKKTVDTYEDVKVIAAALWPAP